MSSASRAGISTSSYGRAAFDVDLDGDVDIMTPTHLGLNDGAGSFTYVPSPSTLSNWSVIAPVAADYDGDGDLEPPGLPNLLRHVVAPIAPFLGGSYTVELHTRQGGAYPGLLVASSGAGVLPIGPFGALKLDPASALVVGAQTGVTPLVVTWAIPNVPALAGTPLNFQGVVADPLQGVVVTNTFGELVQ